MKRLILLLLVVIFASLRAPSPTWAQFVEPDVHVLYTLRAEVPGDSFGWVAERLGDLDRDGASDFVVGAPGSNAGGALAGRAYVYSGRTGALLQTITGQAGDRLGFSTAGPGDLDRDGRPDYVVGGLGRVLALSGRDHHVLFDLRVPGEAFGYDVGAAGDVNRDGHPDVIVGAITAAVGGVRLFGKVYAVSGKDGQILWTHEGHVAQGLLGTGVSGIDDLDGDGVPEQAVGARGAGQAYVLSGRDGTLLRTMAPDPTAGAFGDFFVHDAGDVDRDGRRDILVGDYADNEAGAGAGKAYVYSGRTGDPLWVLQGATAGDGFGIGRGIGDVNHDHHADLFLASYNSSAGAPSGGKLYLYSGKDGRALRTMTGSVAGAQLGFDAVGLGDVNRDRRTDLLVTGVDVAHVVAGICHDDDDDDDDRDRDRDGHHDCD
ncbi:MAG: hypothetical protein R3B48_06120 [Kofleriaceae bacterium]